MATEIHPKAWEAMLGHARKGITLCERSGDHLIPKSLECVDAFSAFTREAAKAQPEWLDENSAWSAAIGLLFDVSDEVLKAGRSLADENGPTAAFVTRYLAALRNLIESLPLTYTVTFPLPGFALPTDCVLDLGSGARLIGPEQARPKSATPNALALSPAEEKKARIVNALLQIPSASPEPARLVVTAAGYASILSSSFSGSALQAAYSIAKKVLIGGYVTGAFELSYSPAASAARTWQVTVCESGKPTVIGTTEAWTRASWHGKWVLTQHALTADTLLGPEDGSLENLARRLALVKKLLMHAPGGPKVNHISAAIEWFFEALQQVNETLGFVQTCTAIEALLGSDNEGKPERYGITAQLADRCAFLLGRDRADREALRKSFSALYVVRSKVVHGIAVRLTRDDQRHSAEANRILRQLLHKELSTLVDRSVVQG